MTIGTDDLRCISLVTPAMSLIMY